MLRYIWLFIIGFVIGLLICSLTLCLKPLERKDKVQEAYDMLVKHPTAAGKNQK